MKVYIVHTVARGKNDPSLVGLKIEKVFKDKSKAEEYAGAMATGEQTINGQLVELRVGLTAADVED